MVDFYAMPTSGERAWPARTQAGALPFGAKAQAVQDAMMTDICGELGRNFDPSRFVPYVVLHEYEGLLFSDCGDFGRGIGREDLVGEFQRIRDQFGTPEEINDSPATAPSARILHAFPGYAKPIHGILAAQRIGLGVIMAECPNFRRWVEALLS